MELCAKVIWPKPCLINPIVLQQPEKAPNYYRNLIKNSLYFWQTNDDGDVQSRLFREGYWIYPYLVEQFQNTEKAHPTLFYPPNEDSFGNGRTMSESKGEFAQLYAAIIWQLYVKQQLPNNLHDYPQIHPLAVGQTFTVKVNALNNYCYQFSTSNYCQYEYKDNGVIMK